MRGRAEHGLDEALPRERSPGRPLESHAARDLGAWFGVSLGDVRVHDDAGAAEAADERDAAAFTHGSDVYFGTDHGVHERSLLLHEVVHTLQPESPHADGVAAEREAGATTHAPRAPRTAVQRQAAAAAPARPTSPIGDANLAAMKSDIEFIVVRLKQQILWADQEQELVDRVRAWADWDLSYQRSSGGGGTPFLDKFLQLLKMRVFSRTTGRVMFGLAGEEWINAYDGLFFELEDDRLAQFRQIVARSKEGTVDAESKQMQTVYGYVGKRVGMGALGIIKNISLSLSSIADTLMWVQWRSQGLPGKPPKLSPQVADGFDFMSKELARALAEGATPKELVQEAHELDEEYQFGDRWGTIVQVLLTAEVGGAAIGIAQGAEGVENAVEEVTKRIEEMRKENPNVTWDTILADDRVRLGINHGLVSLLGVVAGAAGFGGEESAVAKFFERFGLVIGLANVIPQLQQAWIDWSNLDLSKEERDKKLQKDVADIVSTVAVTLGGHAQAKMEAASAPSSAPETTTTPKPPPETTTPPPAPEVIKPPPAPEAAKPPPLPVKEKPPPLPVKEKPPPLPVKEEVPPPLKPEEKPAPAKTEEKPPPTDETKVGPEAPREKKPIEPEGEKPAVDYPSTTVHYGLKTVEEAHASYEKSVYGDPTREAGVWYDPANGEFVVVQGDEGAVSTWWRGDSEMANRSWQLLRHFHPGEGVASRIPSAADFQAMMINQTLGRDPSQPAQSHLDYFDPQGKLQSTTFGFNPHLGTEPFWVIFENEHGAPDFKTFKQPPWEPLSGYGKFLDELGLRSEKGTGGPESAEAKLGPETPKPKVKPAAPGIGESQIKPSERSGLNVDVAAQEHREKTEFREGSGKDVQSAHMVNSSSMTDIANYVRDRALTLLLPKEVHKAFDDYWKDWARDRVEKAGGKEVKVTVAEWERVLNDAAQSVPELRGRTADTMSFMIRTELYLTLGLTPNQLLRVPFSP